MNPEPQRPDNTTTSRSPIASPQDADLPGIWGTFSLGVRVWAREMGRIVAAQARRHELRQIMARLAEEKDLLAGMENAPSPERDLCLREIALLEQETARLRAEAAALRAAPARLAARSQTHH